MNQAFARVFGVIHFLIFKIGTRRVLSFLLVRVLATGASTAAKYLSQARIQTQPEPAGKRMHVFLSWFNSVYFFCLSYMHAFDSFWCGSVPLSERRSRERPENTLVSLLFLYGSQIRGAGGCFRLMGID